jgi:hypothetical protein
MAGGSICSSCLSTDRPQAYTKGWAWACFIVGLFLIVAFIGIPMIILAMFAGRGTRCRRCKGEALIPLETPRGQQMLEQSIRATGL